MNSDKSALQILTDQYVSIFEENLNELCAAPDKKIPARLMKSMAYSLQAGGKRLRPALCLAAAERCGLSPEKALPMAMAVEFIHTASLIHDDLPSMDDDDYRRGSPTNHKVFGESMAILAGDSLLIWAFGYALSHLCEQDIEHDRIIKAVRMLAEASGPAGICGGQVLDTDPESRSSEKDFVYKIARAKTAVLIRASIVCGAMLADVTESTLQCFSDYGLHLGLAFQIVDDILDVTASREELGKTPNKDEAQNKLTFVSAYGLSEAKRLAVQESEKAYAALEPLFPSGDLLLDLAKYLAGRTS